MKKKILSPFLSLIILLCVGYIFAPIKYSWNPSPESTQIGFNLQNFSDYLIQFQIYNESAGTHHRHIFEIEPNGEYGIRINTNVQTRLKIYYCPDSEFSACDELTLPHANIIETSFPLGKTIYISWDGKELLPQNEGPIPYTTVSGYYLTENVQKTNYQVAATKSATIQYPQELGRDPWNVFPRANDYAKTLRVAEVYNDATVAQFVLGLRGTPTEAEINTAWASVSAQWNPDDHPNTPNFARAVMQIINRSRNTLLDSVIRIKTPEGLPLPSDPKR